MRSFTAFSCIRGYLATVGLLLGALGAYGQGGPVAIAGSNAPLCAGAANLLLTESGGAAVSWNWSGPANFSSTDQNPVIPNPTTVAAGNYSVTITDAAGNMATDVTAVSIIAPTVNPVTSQILCNGATTLPIAFTGALPGTQFTWTNTNSDPGLAASGAGNIPAFLVQNAKIVPDTALVTVLPQYTVNGLTCTGAPTVFSIIVQPTPVVSGGPDRPICAGGSTPLQATGGISCVWQPTTGLSGANTCNPTASPSQNTIYTVTVTTASGCTHTDAVAVNIHVPTALVCNNLVSVSLGQSGVVTVTPDMMLQNGTPDGPLFGVRITTQAGQVLTNPIGCAQIGQTLTVKITDLCSNVSCWGMVRVEDKLAPQLTCPPVELSCAITTYTPAYLSTVLGIPAAYPTVQENCGTYTLAYVDFWNDLGCTGSVNGIADLSAYALRRWTATDGHGNSSTCSQYLYFRRIRLTGLTMPPAQVTVSCTNPDISPAVTGAPYYTAYGQIFSLYPNTSFCEMNAVYNDMIIQICDGTFKIRRTWTIYEWCFATSPTNPLIYVQMITVADNTGPQFACPANLTVSTNPVTCCATVDLPDVILTDNCSRLREMGAVVDVYDPFTSQLTGTYPVNGTLTDFPGNNLWTPDTLGKVGITPCLSAGTHIVTYTAKDDCGNTNACSFQLSVRDQTPPVVSCQQSTQVALGADGMASISAMALDAGSFDNCGPVRFKVRRMGNNSCQSTAAFYDQVRFCCSDIGNTVTVVLRVYDVPVPAGNVSLNYEEAHSNSCMVQVLVQDKLKPVCVAPPDFSISCSSFDPSLTAYGVAMATDNCCLDTVLYTADYGQFDTVCNRGTIIRTFQAIDCADQSSVCTQRIVVDYAQDYYLKLPDDQIILGCDGDGDYGVPTFFGQDCELLASSYTDQVFTLAPDACYKIERTWTIINWCTYNPNEPCIEIPNPEPSTTVNSPGNLRGPVVSPSGTLGQWAPTSVKLTPTAPAATNFSSFYAPNANCYKYRQIIKILDSQDPVIDSCPAAPVEVCDLSANAPDLWNDPLWYETATGSHDLCEGPTDLRITAFDSCSALNVTAHYLLFLDLDNDGTMETVVNSEQPPAPGTVHFGNALNPNFQGGELRIFDQRNVLASAKYRFVVQNALHPAGTKKVFSLRFNSPNTLNTYTVPELPYGNHKIKWFVEDGCGNETSCEYAFTVKDCKPPTVVCRNGLAINIMPTQMVQTGALDFLQYAEDNCTPVNLLKYGLRRAGQGTGFPVNAIGQPQTSIVFTCADLGLQPVELWAIDLAGNAGYCSTFVVVQDNNTFCPQGPAAVAGILATETGNGLEEGTVMLTGTGPGANAFNYEELTENDGSFAFHVGIPIGSNLAVIPMKDDNPLNGVTTYDLVLISKHILGLEPITTPYRMIAADANRSGSITTFDIVELRKLILGIYQKLPNNTSWRFVAKDYAFPDPANPFEEYFPEIKVVSNFQPPVGPFDFVAVKVGDVNANALSNGFAAAEERSGGVLRFDVGLPPGPSAEGAGNIRSGETFTVTLRASEAVQGCQFTLQHPGLELLQIQPGAAMRADHFAVFPAAQTLTTAWEGGGQAEFSLRFRAQRSGALEQMLRLASRPTRAEAYALTTGERLDVALQFHPSDGPGAAGVGFALYQNEPNPFTGQTTIGFHLPAATALTLTISDVTGRICWTQRGDFPQGDQRIVLDGDVLSASGLYYYQIETTTDRGSGKMIYVK